MTEFKSFLKTVGGNEGDKCRYNTRLDTYGCGCEHDCSYCYAKSLLNFRKMWKPEDPSVGDIKKIERAIKKLPTDKVVRLGGMTDCFQPIEVKHRNTYQTIELLNEYRVPYLIVTKSALVGTVDYLSLLDKDLAHIQVSVTTTDDALSKTYEKASAPSARMRAIELLQNKGFDVALRLSPFIPQYINEDIINKIHCDKIQVEFLRVNSWIQKWFDIDYSEYTVSQSGYKHLPLEKKIEYLNRLDLEHKQVSVCEDVTEHFHYWREHVNPNKDDCCNLRITHG